MVEVCPAFSRRGIFNLNRNSVLGKSRPETKATKSLLPALTGLSSEYRNLVREPSHITRVPLLRGSRSGIILNFAGAGVYPFAARVAFGGARVRRLYWPVFRESYRGSLEATCINSILREVGLDLDLDFSS